MSCYGIMDEVEKLKGRKVKSVSVVDGKLVIDFTEGDPVRFGVAGDCCSSSWIIEACWSGSTLTGEMEDSDLAVVDSHPEHDSLQIYGTRFKAVEGNGIYVLWANASNGYYGGYWVTA